MSKDPVPPPVPSRPLDLQVKFIAVTFHQSSSYDRKAPVTKVFAESQLRFNTRDDIDRFYRMHFAVPNAGGIESYKVEVSDAAIQQGYHSANLLPFTAMLAGDLHPRLKNATAWSILASSTAGRPNETLSPEALDMQRLIIGLRRDLEQEKLARAELLKQAKAKAARKAEKTAQAAVEDLAKSYKANFDAQFSALEKSLRETLVKAEKPQELVVSSAATCSMSFKLADVGVYPLTDGSGLARVVGKLPAHVGAMLLALDKLPEIRNVNGTVASVSNSGLCLELVAQIKFSQWSNEWLCSWGDDVKVAPKFAIETKSETPTCRVPLSRSNSSSEPSVEPKPATPKPTYTPTCAVPLAGRLSKSSPTNPPRAFPAPVSAPLCKVPLSRASTASPRVGCFKDVPPGLSGAQEEIPWTVKVDTPAAKPLPHPVSDGDAFVCDYCLESINDARFHCESCVDFDVCASCYPSRAKSHAQKHGFVQLDVKTGTPIDSASSSSGDISTSSVRFPILNSVSSSTTVGAKPEERARSEQAAQSGHSSRSQSQSSFADVNVDDLLSDIGSYEHVSSDYPDYSDFEEHF
ncbi:hypothetical protein CJU89_4552 [Yarrowia sp. B02]|nr:hypothetical protein CJU89_4552 [Yarrowia sp. B02]